MTVSRIKAVGIMLIALFAILPSYTFAANKTKTNKAVKVKKDVSKETYPDFAFPETVISNAEAGLKKAISEGNTTAQIDCAIQLVVANNTISTDRMPQMVHLLDSLALASTPQGAAILYSIEAQLYADMYKSSRWTYNNRNLPLDSYPEDPNLWSAGLFAQKVHSLVEKSLSQQSILAASPAAEWKKLLNNADAHALEYFPTLYSLLANRAITILDTFTNGEEAIPFGNDTQALSPSQKCSMLRHNIISQWYNIACNAGNVAEITVTLPLYLEDKNNATCYKAYLEAYEKYKDSPYSCEFVYDMEDHIAEQSNDSSWQNKTKEQTLFVIEKLKESIKTHPDYYRINAAKNLINALRQETGEVSDIQSSYSTLQDIKVVANTVNYASAPYICIYKLPKRNMRHNEIIQSLKSGQCKFIKSAPTKSGYIIPDSCEINFGRLEIGEYLLTASTAADGRISSILNTSYFDTFKVSDLAVVTVKDGSNKRLTIAVLNPYNGMPCKDVTTTISYNINRSPKEKTFKTDAEGMIQIDKEWLGQDIKIKAKRGNDECSYNIWLPNYKDSEETDLRASVFTDLAIYKPGHTCNFSIVAYAFDHKNKSYKLLPEEKLNVVLRNASWQPCDTVVLTSDADGRASGSFVIPKDGMLGRYTINVTSAGENTSYGSTDIRVEEYKQPTFFVEMQTPHNIKVGDTLILKGKATTYSGMPVADAKVKISINQQQFWWMSAPDGNYNTDAVTDANGNFICELTTDRLKDTNFENSLYSVRAAVTSTAGESQESEAVSFRIGNISKIQYTGNNIINAEDKNIVLRYDLIGDNNEQPAITYAISDTAGKVITKGTSTTPSIVLDSNLIPSGTYTVLAEIPGSSDKTEIVIYRPSDKTVPKQTPLWVPETRICNDNDKTRIQVGSSYPDSYILYVVSDNTGIISKGILNIQTPSIKEIVVPTPQMRGDRIQVALLTMHNSQLYTSYVYVTSPKSEEKIEVEKISFRDKISAGGKETWTFRYKLGGKNLSAMPVIATMSDASLNSIVPFRWNAVNTGIYGNRVNLQASLITYTSDLHFRNAIKHLDVPPIQYPDINTYSSYSLYGYRAMQHKLMIRGASLAAPAERATNDMVEEEMEPSYVADGAVLQETVTTGYGTAKKASYTGSVSIESASDEGGAEATDNNVRFRPSEMPLAWFKPNLRTDNEGILEISFDVPDFNTTWQLQMFGYTPDMQNDVSIMEATASKTVMISANSPRFLRTGDHAVLPATIYNNSDKASRLSGRIELFNPLDDTVILSKEYQAQIVEPMGSRVIALEFNVPDNIEFIGYRCIGTAPGFSDGEQSLIAIAPSSSPVTESYPFYMAPDANNFSMKLPKVDKNAQISLQYCDNPIWECVTALPDMSFETSASILSRANKLYGNAIAAGLVKQYPQLAEAINLWTQNGDTTLISPLERNPELKILALQQTPWVNNAGAETLRMSRLSELLDTKKNEAAIQEAIKELAKEQHNGGWSWCEGMEPSMFITGQVLWRLAMLESMGYLPQTNNVQNMIKTGLKFCDTELYKEYIENSKNISTSTMLNYLYIRSFFPGIEMSKNFASLKSKALKAIETEWKEFSIYDKATAATLLWREKRPMAARTILLSLKQYGSKSPERGMWFDNLRSYYSNNTLITTAQALEAYAEISPKAPEIDLLRQWLITERQAQDWGQDAQLAEVIHTILSTGSDWTQSSAPAKVTLNGKQITPSHHSLLTGSFTIPLSASEANGATLDIEKYGTHQSWGGVISRYIAPIEDVKVFSESDVKITKHILRVDETKDGIKVKPVGKNSLDKGQRIRVQLRITSKRDMDYVVITDERGGCMSPTDQISKYTRNDGISYYREVRNEQTNFFLPRLPKGDFIIEYDCFTGQEGTYSIGIATLQSLYAPSISAHSAGDSIQVNE